MSDSKRVPNHAQQYAGLIDALERVMFPHQESEEEQESLTKEGRDRVGQWIHDVMLPVARATNATRLSGDAIRKGTGDVLVDVKHAAAFLDSWCEGDVPTLMPKDAGWQSARLELRFAERALRVAHGEIEMLRARLKK